MLYTEKETYGTSYQEKLWKLKINGAEATHHTRGHGCCGQRERMEGVDVPSHGFPSLCSSCGMPVGHPNCTPRSHPTYTGPPAAPLEFPMGGVFPTGVAVA